MSSMEQLDLVMAHYKQWLADCDMRIQEHRRQLTFAEWLHLQYENARMEFDDGQDG